MRDKLGGSVWDQQSLMADDQATLKGARENLIRDVFFSQVMKLSCRSDRINTRLTGYQTFLNLLFYLFESQVRGSVIG